MGFNSGFKGLMGKHMLFTSEWSGWNVKPTNNVHLMPMRGMSGAKPPVWLYIVHRENLHLLSFYWVSYHRCMGSFQWFPRTTTPDHVVPTETAYLTTHDRTGLGTWKGRQGTVFYNYNSWPWHIVFPLTSRKVGGKGSTPGLQIQCLLSG